MPLFGSPDIEKMKAKRDVQGLIKALSYKKDSLDHQHVTVRQAAAAALGEVGDTHAVESLVAALNDDHPLVSAAAAEGLGKLGTRLEASSLRARAVQPLITALKFSSNSVRVKAAETLGRLGSSIALEPLCAALNDGDDGVRKASARALGQIGDARGVLPLIDTLRWYQNPWEREVVMDALVALGSPAVEPLITALRNENVDVRRPAVHILSQIGDARAVEPLITALTDPHQSVRERAAKALDQLGWKPTADERGASYWIVKQQWEKCIEVGPSAVEPLTAALKDSDQRVRDSAARALGQLGIASAVEPLIAMLKDANRDVRLAAVQILDKLGDTRSVEPLIATLTDSERDVRQAAAQALANLYQGNRLDAASKNRIIAVRKLISKRHSDYETDWDHTCKIYRSHEDITEGVDIDFGEDAPKPLPDISTEKSTRLSTAPLSEIESLKARLLDADSDVCSKAAQELIMTHSAIAADIIIRALPDATNKGTLGVAIGMLGAGRVVEPLLDTLKEKDDRLRINASSILGIFMDARAVEPLFVALKDENEEVSANALKSLRSLASLENPDQVGRQAAIEALGRIS